MRTLLVLAVIAATMAGAAGAARGDDPKPPLVVVVARTSKVGSLSSAELQRVFGGEAITVAGIRLVPFNLGPAAPERIRFDRAILGMAPSAVGRYWVDRRIRGGTGAPRALPSPAYVVRVVAKLPGAIGYVAADQVTSAVKVVAVVPGP